MLSENGRQPLDSGFADRQADAKFQQESLTPDDCLGCVHIDCLFLARLYAFSNGAVISHSQARTMPPAASWLDSSVSATLAHRSAGWRG